MATYHVVQTFSRGPKGAVIADLPREMPSADQAERLARRASAEKVATVAFSRSGDPITGDWDDAIILFQSGDLPSEMFGEMAA